MVLHHLAYAVFIGHHGVHILRHHIIKIAQTLKVDIDDGDIRAHPGSDLRSMRSHDAGSEYQNLGRLYTWYAAEKNTSAFQGLLEVFGALLDGHAAGNL